MATRPWVTAEEVRAYTEQQEVKDRSDDKLAFDIVRAETKVIAKTNNTFEDSETYATIPDPVKKAVILLAEMYARGAVETSKKKVKSETYDDYSYTAEVSSYTVDDLDIDDLLSPYVLVGGKGKTVMRLRKL